MSLNCPHCGQIDMVQKVEAIISAGTASSSGVESTFYSGGSSIAFQNRKTASEISDRLSSARPRPNDFGGDEPKAPTGPQIANELPVLLGCVPYLCIAASLFLVFQSYTVLQSVSPLLVAGVVAAIAYLVVAKKYGDRILMRLDPGAVTRESAYRRQVAEWERRKASDYSAALSRWNALSTARETTVFLNQE